jgi:outer membrane protein OmpA-like peptidoglycan-associated protein/uncharacterized protein YegL
MKRKILLINTFGFILLFFLISCRTQIIPIIEDFSLKQKSIIAGDSTTLFWDVRNVNSISILGIGDSLPPKGKIKISPKFSSKYKLEIPANNNTIKKSISLRVNNPSVEVFNCPDTANDESIILLEWKTANASYVKLFPFTDSLPAEGNFSFMLDTTKTITLKAYNKNGVSTEKSHEIKIFPKEYIEGDKVISEGNDALIYWKFDKTKLVKINGFTEHFKANDALQVRPLKTTTYHFEIEKNDGKIFRKEFKVNVMPAGSFYFSGPRIVNKGDQAPLSWEIKDVDSVRVKGVKKVFKGKDLYSFIPKAKTRVEISFVYKKEPLIFSHTVDLVDRNYMTNEKSINKLSGKMRLDFDIVSVERNKYPGEIKLLVAVVDTSGNFISDLAPENNQASAKKYFKQVIEVIEGKKYPINNYNVREIKSSVKPFDISVVLDYSGSMQGNPINNLEKSLKKLIENKHPDDRISVVKFDDSIVIAAPLIKDKDQLLKQIKFNEFEKYNGSTALYAAGDQGLQTLDSSKNNKMIILFTDGYDNSSFPYYETHSVTAQQLVRKARKEEAKFNIVSFGGETNETAMKFMALLSGGKFYNIRNHKHISQVMSEIPKLTRRYYEISYTPKVADGFRTIELVYNNNVNAYSKTTTQICTDESYDLDNLEQKFQKAGNSNPIFDTLKNFSKLKPISEPQVVVLFNFNEAIILKQFEPKLEKYLKYLNKNPKSEAIIMGHTDSKGTIEACVSLSKERADEIKDYFIKNGISNSRIKTIGFGKSHPIWKDEKQEYQAKENRRVEIVIME